jgi:hypothetical protein
VTNLEPNITYNFHIDAVRKEVEGVYATNISTAGWFHSDLLNYGTQAEILVDDLDFVHIHHQSITGPGKYSTNSSGSWDYLDVDTFPDGNAALDVDGNHVPHVIFVEDAALKFAYLESGVWVTDTIESGRIYNDPHIKIDSNGKAHIAYYADANIMYATNANGPWNLQVFDHVSYSIWGGASPPVARIDIKLDYTGNVHIAYVAFTGSLNPWELWYATNRSGEWEHTSFDSYASNVNMEIGVGGDVHLIYTLVSQFTKHATNQSGDWIVEDILDYKLILLNSMAIDSRGFLHLAYLSSYLVMNEVGAWVPKVYRGNVYYGSVYYGNNIEGEWQFSPIVIDRGYRDQHIYGIDDSLDIALDSLNQVHIVYNDGVSETSRYLTNRSP